MKRYWWILTMLCTISFHGHAQTFPEIEKLLEANDILNTEDGYEDVLNTLSYLWRHPLNLNTAGFDSLKMLFFLSDSQIDNILNFRKKQGNFSHLSELLLVTGIGQQDLDNIRPFVRIGPQTTKRTRVPQKLRFRHTLFSRVKTTLPRQIGYRKYDPNAFARPEDYQKKENQRFIGPPWSSQIRYKLEAGKQLQAGLTLENDAGEPYRGATLFDFFSAHVALNGEKWFKRIILGDYKLQLGQGVIAWQGFSSGKSSDALNNEKSANSISPYTSTDENNYLRGLACSFQPLKQLTTTIFISYKKTDGNLKERDTLDTESLITASLLETGYHRNKNERKNKHTLKEFTTGFTTSVNHTYFRIGFNALYYNFSPRLHTGMRPYQQYADNGNKRFLASIDYKTGFHHFYLFGETALSDGGSLATINGIRYSGWSKMAANLIYRRYGKKYTSHYNNAFAEYANTSNEEGIYIGIETSPLKNLKLTAYYDYFKFFAPRYLATIPGSGKEYAGKITYTLKRYECMLYVKHESKPEDHKTAEELHSVQRQKTEWRIQGSGQFHPNLEIRTRFTYTRYRKAEKRENGYLIYGDFIYTSPHKDFKTQIRLAYFDTDSYHSRVYSYEHNVLYGYSFPAYYDRGIRSYINLNWKPFSILTLYVKGGVVYYPDKAYISSSLTRVNDNKLFDLTFQIRIRI